MNLEKIKAWFEENKDQDDVKQYLEGLSAVSSDKVKGFLETDEGKQLIQPTLDKYHNKSLESWKTNNLEKLIEDEINKRNPTKTPAEIELEKLRKQFEDSEKARNREALKNKALEIAAEKGLPQGVLDYFIGEDEETTLANLATFESEVNAAIQAGVEEKFKQNGRGLGVGGTGGNDKSGEYGKKLAESSAKNNENLEDARKSYFE